MLTESLCQFCYLEKLANQLLPRCEADKLETYDSCRPHFSDSKAQSFEGTLVCAQDFVHSDNAVCAH